MSERSPTREELQRDSIGELPPEPSSLAEFLGQGSHLGVRRTVAIVTVGAVLREIPEELRPRTGPAPPPIGRGPATDYTLRLEEVLSPSALLAGDSVTRRISGPVHSAYFSPFPHPREGARLLLVLVPDLDGEAGVYRSYAHGTADITGSGAHLADAWRTSVSVLGVPDATPAFIEAVQTAVAPRPA